MTSSVLSFHQQCKGEGEDLVKNMKRWRQSNCVTQYVVTNEVDSEIANVCMFDLMYTKFTVGQNPSCARSFGK